MDKDRAREIMEAVRNGICDFGTAPAGYVLQLKDAGLKIDVWTDELWP